MLIVLSPAKNLDYESSIISREHSLPQLMEDTQRLVEYCKELSPQNLSSLMSISDQLAALNAQRFADWQLPFNENNARQAVLAFNGDVYAGLQAQSFSSEVVPHF